jgi:DNA-binding response OmpR family regulator
VPSPGATSEAARSAPGTGAPEGRVLVVDDDPANVSLLAAVLRRAGFETEEATSGGEALGAAAVRPPDLVLLDVVMPGLDGFATCRRLKALPGCGDVPVVFVTAMGEIDAKVEAFEAGGVDHVAKPFDAREVVARVHAHVSLRRLRQTLAAERAALAERNAELQRVVAELESALAHVDTLRGLLPICAHCKRIRDDQGYWHRVEAYVSDHSRAQFTHGICPHCLDLHYPAPPEDDPEGGER